MKTIFRLLCGLLAIAITTSCSRDELMQIETQQKPIQGNVISVKAYTPGEPPASRLAFEDKGTEGLKLSWSEGDAFTAVIGEEKVTFIYDVDSEQFTATLPVGVALTDGIVAYYPAYTGEYSTDLSQQTGALNSAKTFMEGTYHAASNSFTFAHSTAILKATFSGLPQEAEVASIKIGAAPYTISIPYNDDMDLAESGIYIYLPNVAKNENVVFSVSTTAGEVYTATQAVKLDEGIKVGTYYAAPIILTSAACNLPTGNDFNTAITGFLQGKDLTQITFIANSVNTDNSNPIGSSNAYMVANGNVLEIHTAEPKFVFNADSKKMFSDLSIITAIDFGDDIDTSNVEDMSYMFNGCLWLTSFNLSGFDTSKVTDMSYMFYNCFELTSLNLSGFDTSNATNMSDMFSGCKSITSLDLRNFNTSNVTNMSAMFAGCNALTSLDLSSFDTSKVEDMRYMFSPCPKLTSLDLGNFDTSKVTDMSYMFATNFELTSLDLSNFDFSLVTDFTNMFAFLGKNAVNQPIPVCVTQAGYDKLKDAATGINDEYAKYVFPCELPYGRILNGWLKNYVTGLRKIKFVANSSTTSGPSYNAGSSTIYIVRNPQEDFLEIHTASPRFVFNVNSEEIFKDFNYITTIDFGDNIDTSNVTKMNDMFWGCSSLTTIDFGDNIDTSNVTDMSDMFYACQALTSLDLSKFDTSNVMTMSLMFYQCKALTTLDLRNFDTSKVANMGEMFYSCQALTSLNLSSFDTSKVGNLNMNYMFGCCYRLTSLDLSSFNFSNDYLFSNMFKYLGEKAANKPISVYVKNENDKTLLESKSTGINSNYAQIVVKQP